MSHVPEPHSVKPSTFVLCSRGHIAKAANGLWFGGRFLCAVCKTKVPNAVEKKAMQQ
jgi:hypothetical protein